MNNIKDANIIVPVGLGVGLVAYSLYTASEIKGLKEQDINNDQKIEDTRRKMGVVEASVKESESKVDDIRSEVVSMKNKINNLENAFSHLKKNSEMQEELIDYLKQEL